IVAAHTRAGDPAPQRENASVLFSGSRRGSPPCDDNPVTRWLDQSVQTYTPDRPWHNYAATVPSLLASFFDSFRCACRVTPTFGTTTSFLKPVSSPRVTFFLAQIACSLLANKLAKSRYRWHFPLRF